MKFVAAYLLAVLCDNTSPTAEDLTSILGSVGADSDEDNNTPVANPNGPTLPQGHVPAPAPPQHVGVAPPAVQQEPAPPARRSRAPRGPVTPATNKGISSAPALLELSAAYPMYTEQRRAANFFVPDAQMLFHVLSICDQMMNATDRFLRSAPAWLPIVSQLYIAVLWNVMILRVYVNSGYGSHFSPLLEELITHHEILECMIPGPLVPFFQSLAAVNGPFDWIGDIIPGLPSFDTFWVAAQYAPSSSHVRQVPVPAIILDQLYHFATWPIPANATTIYSTFEWYRSVFSQGVGTHNARLRLGPQLCGSLFTTQSQCDLARDFWNSVLANGFTRINATDGQPQLTNFAQLFGFMSQTNQPQLNWFQQTVTVMKKYSQYFNGSAPLKSVLPTGIGACVIYGVPVNNTATRAWFYPAAASIEPFTTGRFNPRREIPDTLTVKFSHADHEIEEQAEQYAIVTHTNIKWADIMTTQNNHTAINALHLHRGDYWTMMAHRHSTNISLKTQFAQLIVSRYHQQAANRVD